MDVCSQQDTVSHIWQHLECGMEGTMTCEEVLLDASVV